MGTLTGKTDVWEASSFAQAAEKLGRVAVQAALAGYTVTSLRYQLDEIEDLRLVIKKMTPQTLQWVGTFSLSEEAERCEPPGSGEYVWVINVERRIPDPDHDRLFELLGNAAEHSQGSGIYEAYEAEQYLQQKD